MPIHHLMVGTWAPPGAIFTFAFDDERLTVELIKRTEVPHDEPISWMTLSHDKKTLYGAAVKRWSSYDILSPTSIVHSASFPLLHNPQAQSPAATTRAIFLLASRTPPYAVYCNPFYAHAGHGSVFTVKDSGALDRHVQAYDYQPGSGVHGMVFDPTEEFLYSADLTANKIWVHRRRTAGRPELDPVGAVDCPDQLDHPRWLAMHPSGRYLYVLMEAGNRLCEYTIPSDNTTPLPVFTNRHWPLVPPCLPDSHRHYRADVVAVSHSGRYLFASARANSVETPGYMTAFRLRDDGAVDAQRCLQPTSTSGGHSNAISPADWTDEWLALTDEDLGWLEIFRWKDECLTRVARVRVQEPGFGMNAVWYD